MSIVVNSSPTISIMIGWVNLLGALTNKSTVTIAMTTNMTKFSCLIIH
jgi:hypothetical protein